MAKVRHKFQSVIADDPLSVIAGEVVPSNWNDSHTFSLGVADIEAAGGLTSASAATLLATYVTSNSLSAAVATDDLTVRGGGNALKVTVSAAAASIVVDTGALVLRASAGAAHYRATQHNFGNETGNNGWQLNPNSNLIPGLDDSFDLGVAAFRIRDLYVGGDLHLSGTASVGVLRATGGIQIQGASNFADGVAISAGLTVGSLAIGGHAFNLSLSQSVATGQVLTYNNADNKWRNVTPSGGVATLDDVGDVSLSHSVQDGQFLTWNEAGGQWVNTTVTPAGVSSTLTIDILQTTVLTVLGSATFSGTADFGKSIEVSLTASVGFLNIGGTSFVPGDYLTSNSFSAIIATYVTSNSLSAALATYLSSNSFSAAIAAYITSNSVSIALVPYLTSASAALSTYLTSNSFSAAIAAYVTSGSIATAVITANLTVTGSATFSGTAIFSTALAVSGSASVGTLIVSGTSTLSGNVRILTNLDVSATASIGGTLRVGGSATFSGTAVFLTGLAVSGTLSTGGLVVTAGATFNGSATFSGTVLFLTDVRIAADLHVSQTASVGALNIAGTSFVPGDYLTSNSFSAAIAAYATSNSVSSMIAAQIAAGGFLTSASACSSLLTTTLTVLGSATFSGTADFGKSIEVSLTASVGHLNVAGTVVLAGHAFNLSLSQSVADGQVLTYNNADNKWRNAAATAVVNSLDDVTDVSLSHSVADGQVLTWNNTANQWINATPSGGVSNTLSISVLQVGDAFRVLGTATFSGHTTFLSTVSFAGAVQFAGTVSFSATVAFLNATVTTLGVTGSASFAAQVNFAASVSLSAPIQMNGFPMGSVLLGSASLGTGTSLRFSGSWSDYGLLELRCFFKATSSGSVNLNIYTDGGTTTILTCGGLGSATASYMFLDADIFNGTAFKGIAGKRITNAVVAQAATATANTGFINALQVSVGTSLTLSSGYAQLYGRRR